MSEAKAKPADEIVNKYIFCVKCDVSYDVLIAMFVGARMFCYPGRAFLSLLILLCIAWGVYLYHYEDIYGEKPYFRER